MENQNWTVKNVLKQYEQPLFELVYRAYECHRQNFDVSEIEYCTLSSIKTGRCPEDCAYCPQSGHYNTGLKNEKLIEIDKLTLQVYSAKASGAKRFCIGAAWKSPPRKEFDKVLKMIHTIKAIGLESCATLGTLNAQQAKDLKKAGLDYYNHNLDSSPEFYKTIIRTRTYQERLDTLEHVANANINICCGGILGMGETREDRAKLLIALYHLPTSPKSIPINQLIPIAGTPLENTSPIESLEFIKTIAITRLMFPNSRIRLAAGRENMSNEFQAWCFMAGANSIFIGEKLLTANNSTPDKDYQFLNQLGFNPPNQSI